MATKKRSKHLLVLLFLFLLLIISVFTIFLITKKYSEAKQLSSNWKNYSSNRLLFKVKVPQDTKTQIVPAGFDNGMGFGPDGISRIDFFNKDFLIMVDPFTNSRNDQTLQQLRETRDFNGITNTAQPSYCSKDANEEEIQLQTGGKALLCDSVLPNGRKFGIVATVLGKKYFYNISTGSIYSSNFTNKEEKIFMEFLNTFQATD